MAVGSAMPPMAAMPMMAGQRGLDGAAAVDALSVLEPTQAKNPYENHEAILKDIDELEKEARQLRLPEEYDWETAWRYYNGKHWGEWVNGALLDIDEDEVPHIVLNFILYLVQTKLGHLIKNRPILQGVPATPDEAARNATRTAVRAFEAYWRKLKLPKKLSEALLWMLVCGKSFWKVYWDPMAGPRVKRPGQRPKTNEAGEPLFDAQTGEPATEPYEIDAGPEGDLCIEVGYPHEILVDPGARDIDSAQKLLHTTFKPISETVRRYKITKEEAESLARESDEAFDTMRRLEGLSSTAGLQLRGRVKVIEAWYRPSEDYPEGLYAVVVGGKVRIATPTPEGYGAIPFVEFDEIRTNGFWSTSTARQLLDLNKMIDLELSQQEHMRSALRYKTMVPAQAQVDKDAFDRTDTEVVEYWDPFKPWHLAPPNIAPHHIEIRNFLVQVLKEVGGNFDVLAGRVGGEVRSGRQTAYLQEYAGTVLGVVAQQIEWAITGAGNIMLPLLQKKVREQRFEAFVGRDRRVQILQFIGADLEGCKTIEVQPGSALPLSRTEKWDRITDWIKQGWLDPQKGLRLLDLGDFDTEIFAEEEQDRQNADEMIFRLLGVQDVAFQQAHATSQALAMKEGNLWSERYVLKALQIEAFDFDNHPIHVQQLDRNLRKTRTYRDWPPERRALADALVEWHKLLAAGGPIERPIGGDGTELAPEVPPADLGQPGVLSPGARAAASGEEPPALTGSPNALQGQKPPGGGGIAENGAERQAGLPSVPRPPGPGPGPGAIAPNPAGRR